MVLLALACAAVLIATAALAVMIADAARARLIVYGVCLIASLALFSIALLALLGISDRPSAVTLPLGLPWLGAHFRLDALSAFFLAVVNLGAAAASLFALGYGRHEDAPRRVLPFYPAFLAGMSIVVLADDAFTFLVSWEFMSLSSWALVMAHHRVADNVRAGYVYLIMASFGTLALLLTFGLLAGADGTYAFADIRGAHPSAALAASILILALIGAGSKAGLVPLHVWLPLAHPAAPSQVSALMSGVMTKVAVYGFVRIAFDLIGTPACLIHRMPQTAFVFLVGCAAISALPPLNGFVSEWLTFQAILLSPQLPSWGLKFLVPAVGALLALSAALAAACFVKAFGVTFLGRARTSAAARARETDRFSLAAMFFFAALCLVAGILPGFFIDALAPVTEGLVGARMPVQGSVDWLSIVPIAESRSSYNGLLVFAFMVLSGAIAAWAIHRLASDKLRRAPPLDCGYPDESPATQYTASSFAQPIRRVFGTVVFYAREHVEIPPPGDGRPARLTVELHDLVWDALYAPIAGGIGFAADKLNHLQFLTIRQFLSLVFAALVLLLLVLAIWP